MTKNGKRMSDRMYGILKELEKSEIAPSVRDNVISFNYKGFDVLIIIERKMVHGNITFSPNEKQKEPLKRIGMSELPEGAPINSRHHLIHGFCLNCKTSEAIKEILGWILKSSKALGRR